MLGLVERVAVLLEETAAAARRRGGDAAAARALERAAELSPGKPHQARRLLAAGEVARHTGQSDWVQELAARVQIVILASQGLTNGEIADRLFLSPHTVATHLYNSYPKLGIACRHQLRDLIDQATDPPAAPPARG